MCFNLFITYLNFNLGGSCCRELAFFGNFNCYWFWKRSLLRAFKKNQFTMKIERVTCIWMFVYSMNFELWEIAKNYLDIQAITPLLCLLLVLYVLVPSIHSFFYVTTTLEKWCFPALKSLRLPEFDGTRFILKRNEVSIENYLKITFI